MLTRQPALVTLLFFGWTKNRLLVTTESICACGYSRYRRIFSSFQIARYCTRSTRRDMLEERRLACHSYMQSIVGRDQNHLSWGTHNGGEHQRPSGSPWRCSFKQHNHDYGPPTATQYYKSLVQNTSPLRLGMIMMSVVSTEGSELTTDTHKKTGVSTFIPLRKL